MTALPALLAEARPFSSPFQIERFVIAMNGITLWGAFQQCLRELRTRWDALTLDYFEIEKAKLEMEEAEGQFYEEPNVKLTIEQRKHRLEGQRLRARIAQIEVLAADRARELGHFLALARAYRKQFGTAPLTQEKRDSYDRDYWEEVVKAQIAIELLSGMPRLSGGLQQQINSLPVDMRARVLATMAGPENQKALVERWSSNSTTVPDVEDVPSEDVRRLVCQSQFPQLLPES